MSTTQQMRQSLDFAATNLAEFQTGGATAHVVGALEHVMNALDTLLTEREKAEAAVERQRQIDEALMSL